jgi:pSer/pThr/pTyr-binding forkhead associated (FHA) protein
MVDRLDTQHTFRFGNFYNATFLYGLDFASVGLSNIPKESKGYREIVADPQPRTYQKTILKDDVPVGMLALGDRKSVLAFKRAIDHQVNLSSVASRLFSPDFSLEKWLDSQGVPLPIVGVSREGEADVNKVAYRSGKQSAIRTETILTEAVLTPLEPSEAKAQLSEFYLSQTKTSIIGRLENASLPLNFPSISRQHAEISFANGQYVLRDLGSRNGTSVNDTPLEPGSIRILQANDRVSFGKVLWKFQLRTVNPESSFLLKRQKESSKSAHDYSLITSPPEKVPGEGVGSYTCSTCGTTLNTVARFCPSCGAPVPVPQTGS